MRFSICPCGAGGVRADQALPCLSGDVLPDSSAKKGRALEMLQCAKGNKLTCSEPRAAACLVPVFVRLFLLIPRSFQGEGYLFTWF